MDQALFPLLAAFTQASSLILHKIGLTRRRIDLGVYLPLLFLFLSLYTLVTLPFLGWIHYDLVVQPHNLLLLVAVPVVATIWNYLYFLAIKAEKVNSVENIINLGPVFTIVIAWLLAPLLFDPRIAMVAGGATLVLVWGYWEKQRFAFNKVTALLLLSVILASLESVLVAQVLQAHVLSPAVLFFIRVIIMWGFFSAYYKPSYAKVKTKTKTFIGLNALLSLVMMLIRFYALRDSGVIYTSLVLVLVPIIVYIGSSRVLHEKLKFKQVVSATAILGVIIYATILKIH
jgi:drug/metabolite transporter (DMT)-like permease